MHKRILKGLPYHKDMALETLASVKAILANPNLKVFDLKDRPNIWGTFEGKPAVQGFCTLAAYMPALSICVANEPVEHTTRNMISIPCPHDWDGQVFDDNSLDHVRKLTDRIEAILSVPCLETKDIGTAGERQHAADICSAIATAAFGAEHQFAYFHIRPPSTFGPALAWAIGENGEPLAYASSELNALIGEQMTVVDELRMSDSDLIAQLGLCDSSVLESNPSSLDVLRILSNLSIDPSMAWISCTPDDPTLEKLINRPCLPALPATRTA